MYTIGKGISDCESLIFLHIPKAAGTSLHSIVERQYPQEAIFNTDGADVHRSIEEFKNLPESQREKVACLKGHMRFGLHVYLPQPCAYITLLRDPVDRVISTYHYILRTPQHYLYEQVTSQNMTLDAYVRNGISYMAVNGQTRVVAGIQTDEDENPPSDMLEVAKKNLREHFLVVGLAERFDESLILMKRRLGWRWVYYTRRNVTPNRPSKSVISESTVRLIQQTNEKDLELYAFAKQLFLQDIREEGPSFEREVRTFRLLNKVYGIPWKVLDQLRCYSFAHRIWAKASPIVRRQ